MAEPQGFDSFSCVRDSLGGLRDVTLLPLTLIYEKRLKSQI